MGNLSVLQKQDQSKAACGYGAEKLPPVLSEMQAGKYCKRRKYAGQCTTEKIIINQSRTLIPMQKKSVQTQSQ